MGFNCAQKAKFDREWLRLRKEYADAGMSEAAIQKIYDLRLVLFMPQSRL